MGELTVETIGDRVLGSIFIIFKLPFLELLDVFVVVVEVIVDCSFSLHSLPMPYIGFTPEAGLPKYLGMFLILKILAGLD